MKMEVIWRNGLFYSDFLGIPAAARVAREAADDLILTFGGGPRKKKGCRKGSPQDS
jgi:hypothetical protein